MFGYQHIAADAAAKWGSTLCHIRAKRHPSFFAVQETDRQIIGNQLASTDSFFKKTTGEEDIIDDIKQHVRYWNQNNVTRTEAYRRFYKQHREVHWALVAHMVSRNSGWCMTDIKGEWMPRLLGEKDRLALFEFFETANALIFQDAFAQLLLYEKSKKAGRSLFHLLPAFHVSRFMKPFWDHFWKHQNAVLLTTALIINEQHYIERRIVSKDYYQHRVFETLPFKGQELIQLTQVIFPYVAARTQKTEIRLAGLILEDFADIKERIEAGKRMYAILFGIGQVANGVSVFMEHVYHTGSRCDYWPGFFTHHGRQPYSKERLIGTKLKKEAPAIFSPELKEVWGDWEPAFFSKADWFHHLDVLDYVSTISIPFSFDMTGEFCLGLNKLETAVLTVENLPGIGKS